MDRGYNRENGAGATGVPLRNAPASSRSALATDSYFQGETHDLYSFELHEQSQKADGAMSEESYTALRGIPKKGRGEKTFLECWGESSILHYSRGCRKLEHFVRIAYR